MEMDGEEVERIVKRYAAPIYRLAYARTGNHADAQDVMQEVFLRLLRANPALESEDHCRAWLLRVAANCANDLFRAPWRRSQPLSEGLPAPEPETGGVLEAVLALPGKYRIPVHLYYYEGLSVAEIAAALGRSEGVVKTRLFRARGMLRLALEEGEEHV